MSTSEQYLVKEAYRAVLENEDKFFSPDDKKDIYIKDFLHAWGSGYDAELEVTHFTILDMDEDKIPEVILELSVVGKKWTDFYEVLHYTNRTVYGYLRVYRGLEELKNDGTFTYSGGAGDWGSAKLRFTSNGCEEDRLVYCESNTNNDSYFVNNKPVSYELFTASYKEHEEKSGAVWHEFSQKNIEMELSNK
jgi:hypothetical protein